MRNSIIVLVFSALFIGGCTQQTEIKTVTDSKIVEEHQHSASDSIELNNGVKWKVVPEMMQHIRNMESDLKQFSVTNHNDLKSYMQLGSGLQKNIDLLTSNCTMEGKAHDELHKWLLPYIDLVAELNKSEDVDGAQHSFKEIESSFKVFGVYFE